MPGSQPTVETPVRRWVIADLGQPARGREHVLDVHQRLAHAHEHEVVDRLDAAEVQHLVEDLRGVQVAAEAHRPGRAEGARQRAAGLRGDADRAAPVAVAHQHRLHGPAVGRVEERLDGPIARRAPRRRARASRTARARPARRAAPPGGRSSPRSRARRRRPSATPAASGSRAGRARPASRRAAPGPRPYGGSGCGSSASPGGEAGPGRVGSGADAPRQVPRPRRRRLAPRGGAARVRRPRDRRRRRSCAIPARDVGEHDAVAVDGKPALPERRHVVYALHKPAGYVSTAKDPQGRPTVLSLVRSRERLYPVGRLDADSTGLILLTNDGELAHRLTHPSFEVPRVYRAQVRSPPVREPALRRLREGVLLEDGRTAPARVRRLAPDRLEIVHARGAQAPGAAHVRGRRAPRACGWSGSPSARCGSATFRSAATARLSAAEVERAAARAGYADGLAPDRPPRSQQRRGQRGGADPRRDRGADARADRAQRARYRRPRELHLHAHARPRRRVPGGRRAPHGPQPRAADVRAGDRRARAR